MFLRVVYLVFQSIVEKKQCIRERVGEAITGKRDDSRKWQWETKWKFIMTQSLFKNGEV